MLIHTRVLFVQRIYMNYMNRMSKILVCSKNVHYFYAKIKHAKILLAHVGI